MPERSAERTGTVIIRNGVKLCAACRSLGCESIGVNPLPMFSAESSCQMALRYAMQAHARRLGVV